MDNDKSELRWGVAQRLEFIEFRLFWEGYVNRSDLMEQFGLSVNQASADLNRYIGFAPDNMVYDKSARTYVRGLDFNARSLSVRWADTSFSTEMPIRNGTCPSSMRDAKPSPSPPGPANRSTMPKVEGKSDS